MTFGNEVSLDIIRAKTGKKEKKEAENNGRLSAKIL